MAFILTGQDESSPNDQSTVSSTTDVDSVRLTASAQALEQAVFNNDFPSVRASR